MHPRTEGTMSFEPKPVNFALNRDMLGKILSHTREDMADEVNKMTFKTQGDILTLKQVKSYILSLELWACFEPDCDKVVYSPSPDCFRCDSCNVHICYKHTYYRQMGYYEHMCGNCKEDVCLECKRPIVYNKMRVAKHNCKYPEYDTLDISDDDEISE